MNKLPDMKKVIAYLQYKGIFFKTKDKKIRRMNYYCEDYDFCEIISMAKRNYTMDNQS